MNWRLFYAWCENDHETDLLEKYGLCCKTPCLLAIYSIDADADDSFFIGYSCGICDSKLYVTNKISTKVGIWI